ncbi:MAG: hypothetical protein U0O13_05945, partial [Oscillospiraceae bacterium]
CSLSGIFFAAHVAEENDRTFFRRCGGERLRGPLTNCGGNATRFRLRLAKRIPFLTACAAQRL